MKTGILLTNLGTPDAPTAKAVRRYLAEFLWDPYVVDKPRWLWWLVLHGIVLRVRPKRSAAAYQKIWDAKHGSPLLHYSKLQTEKLKRALSLNPSPRVGEMNQSQYTVALGMRYGNPSLTSGIQALSGCDRIMVIPLYPQYSIATTKTTQVLVDKLCRKVGIKAVEFISEYYDHPQYIKALAESVKRYWQQQGKPQLLLMSFHGLPKRYVTEKGDPYQQQCIATGELLAKALKLDSSQYRITFQSRFGPETWLQPYTDKTLEALPQEGVTHVQVICPGFSVDCIETLEEIDMQNRAIFLEHGGKQFDYIPALNDDDMLIEALSNMCHSRTGGNPVNK